MVNLSKKNWALFFLLLPAALFAGDFTASVSRNSVAEGESLTLNLKLTDASPEGPPAVHALRSAFVIHSQQQSSNTVFVNGRLSSSVDWHYILLPKKQGEVTIPALKVETSEGTLASNPITIHVSERPASGVDDERAVTLTTQVSKASPYKHEPFGYTVKLISRDELANVNVQKLEVENGIVEMPEQPRVEEKIVEGVRVKVIEVNYLITPLKAGVLTIPPVVIQGGVPTRIKRRARSFFDDEFSPFQMLRQFDRLEPFLLSTDEMQLEVVPPEPGVAPWLPAQSLTLEESWVDTPKLRVGEPLTRSLAILAEGVRASQLPDLKEFQAGGEDFKVYADKPDLSEEIKSGVISSTRKEKFTLIPQRPGEVVLPEISIKWWDVSQNRPAAARIPSRTITVEPAVATQPSSFEKDVERSSYQQLSQPPSRSTTWLYVLLGVLSTLLVCVFLWAAALNRRIARLTDAPPDKTPKRMSVHLNELERVETPQQQLRFLQAYAHSRWQLQKNAALDAVCEEMRKRSPEDTHARIRELKKYLEDALYRGKAVDCGMVSKGFGEILAKEKALHKDKGERKEQLPRLNPE